MDGPLHEDFASAGGTTLCGDFFQLDVLSSATIDWESSDLPPEDEQLVEDIQMQWSLVYGWLNGPAGSLPVAATTFSGFTDGEQLEHRVVLLAILSPEEIEMIETNVEYRYFLGAIPGFPCGGLPLDPEFEACADLSKQAYDASYDTLQDTQLIIGTTGSVAAGAICFFTLGVACPAAVGGVVVWNACMLSEAFALNNSFKQALQCCCTGLECRINGGTNCPTPTDYRDGSDWDNACTLNF